MSKSNIAKRLQELRSGKGVNQDVAAESCDISRIALARYETGTRVPRIEIAARLAEYYGVSVDYILGRDDEISAPDPTSIPLGIDLGNAYAGAIQPTQSIRYAGGYLPGQEPIVVDAGSSSADLTDEAIYSHYLQSHGPETAQTVIDMLNKLRRLTPEQVAQTEAFVSFLEQQAEKDNGNA